jgi:hypothetical protein
MKSLLVLMCYILFIADTLVIMTMSYLILMQRTEKTQPDYKIEALKNLLQTRYGYSQRVLTTEQLLQLLVDHLRNSGL